MLYFLFFVSWLTNCLQVVELVLAEHVASFDPVVVQLHEQVAVNLGVVVETNSLHDDDDPAALPLFHVLPADNLGLFMKPTDVAVAVAVRTPFAVAVDSHKAISLFDMNENFTLKVALKFVNWRRPVFFVFDERCFDWPDFAHDCCCMTIRFSVFNYFFKKNILVYRR